jgi:hypothetical protein
MKSGRQGPRLASLAPLALLKLLAPALLSVMVLAAWPGQAGSEQPAGRVSLKERLTAWNKTQSWMGDMEYLLVRFDEPAFEKIYGKEVYPLLQFGLAWYPVENLSIGWYTGGMYESGHAIGAINGKSSGEATELYVIPLELKLRYRFAYVENQWVVPSVWVGADYWWFKELNRSEDNVQGHKLGWDWGGDVALLLDRLDPAAARYMKMDLGVDDTYLVFGYQAQSVGGSGDGLSFDSWAYTLGLRFETAGVKP